MSFRDKDIEELAANGDLDDSNAPIACSNCDAEASLYAYKYDEAITAAICGTCGHKEWATDAPTKGNPRMCPSCDSYVTDEDVDSGRSIQCTVVEEHQEMQCEQLSHKDCVDYCDKCGWFCEDELAENGECDSCGKIHYASHFVSFGRDFVDEFGHVCYSCFDSDEDQFESSPDGLDPALVGTTDNEDAVVTCSRSASLGIVSSTHTGDLEGHFERKRDDQSAYLSHFVRQRSRMNDDECCEQLLKILREKKLEARATGYFGTYDQIPTKTALSKAVCFTEGRLSALYGHAKAYSSFGLAFSKFALLKDKGAAPAMYIHGDLIDSVRGHIPDKLVPFVNIIKADVYNFQHEREWRVAADLKFEHSEVRCIFAPEKFHLMIRKVLECDCRIFCLEALQRL